MRKMGAIPNGTDLRGMNGFHLILLILVIVIFLRVCDVIKIKRKIKIRGSGFSKWKKYS